MGGEVEVMGCRGKAIGCRGDVVSCNGGAMNGRGAAVRRGRDGSVRGWVSMFVIDSSSPGYTHKRIFMMRFNT